jgi:hypothetical protein
MATAKIAATDLLPWHRIVREKLEVCVTTEWECEVDGAGVYIESARRWSRGVIARGQGYRWIDGWERRRVSEAKVASEGATERDE